MILSNLPTLTFFYILLAYFIGGITQGILGVGLITVVISLLSFVVDVKETIALVIIPTIITSFFQMINGNNLRKISIDTKFFLIFSTLIIIPGVILLKTLQSDLILIFIAILLFVNSSLFLSYLDYTMLVLDSFPLTKILGNFLFGWVFLGLWPINFFTCMG